MVLGKKSRPNFFLLFFLGMFLCLPPSLSAQYRLQVTIKDGFGISSCTSDVSRHRWQVNIDETGWVTYPFLANCFNGFPNQQMDRIYPCAAVLPDSINVSYRSFKNDGLSANCQIVPDCIEEYGRKFRVPQPGDSLTFTIEISNKKPTWGYVIFTIRVLPGENISNDLRCDAIDLGTLLSTFGDSSAYTYNNFCADNAQEPDALVEGDFSIEAGTWFSFQTPPEPIPLVQLLLKSDPTDAIGLEAALFNSQGNDCSAAIQLRKSALHQAKGKVGFNMSCLEPNQTYYLLVDGDKQRKELLRGNFSLFYQAIESEEAADQICDALSLQAFLDSAQIETINWQSNYCASPVGDPKPIQQTISQAVWYRFNAPPTGHVRISAWTDSLEFGFSPRLAVYRADKDCSDVNGTFWTLNKRRSGHLAVPLNNLVWWVDKSIFSW